MHDLLGKARLLREDIVRHGLVVDDGLATAVGELEDGIARIVERLDLGVLDVLGLGGSRRADLHGELPAVKILEALDLVLVALGDEHRQAGLVERLREENALLALLGDGEAGGADVDGAGEHCRDDAVKGHVRDLDLVARLLAHRADKIHFEARDLLRLRVDEFKGREGGVGGDAQVLGFNGAGDEDGGGEDGGKGFLHEHFGLLRFFL